MYTYLIKTIGFHRQSNELWMDGALFRSPNIVAQPGDKCWIELDFILLQTSLICFAEGPRDTSWLVFQKWYNAICLILAISSQLHAAWLDDQRRLCLVDLRASSFLLPLLVFILISAAFEIVAMLFYYHRLQSARFCICWTSFRSSSTLDQFLYIELMNPRISRLLVCLQDTYNCASMCLRLAWYIHHGRIKTQTI